MCKLGVTLPIMGLYKQSCPCKVWEIGSCHMTSLDVHVAQYTYHTVCAPTPRMHLSAIPQLYSRSILSPTSGPKDYSHTHTHAHTHARAHVHMHTHAYTRTHMHTHTHTCTHTHTRTHTHMHTHTRTHFLYELQYVFLSSPANRG